MSNFMTGSVKAGDVCPDCKSSGSLCHFHAEDDKLSDMTYVLMTLTTRDYFAAVALLGYLANHTATEDTIHHMVSLSFKIADAMVAKSQEDRSGWQRSN